MPPDALCDRCGQPAHRTLAAERMCHGCADAILEPIRQRVAERSGIVGWGVPQAPRGDGWHDLVCHRCGAGWVGRSHDPCWWCDRHLQIVRAHQADLVRQPPDVDPDDARHQHAMTVWAQRLARAVAADLITDRQAIDAWTRATSDRPAA